MKRTKGKAPARPDQDRPVAPTAPPRDEEETDRRIDEIAERHRETLERLARD